MSAALNDPRKATFKTYSDPAKTTPADATTVVLSLRDPRDGTVTTPTVTHEGTGVYSYQLPDDVSGLWLGRWVATGAVATSSRTFALQVDDQWPPALVGLDDARAELNFDATVDDDELQTWIYTASALLLNHPSYRVKDAATVTPAQTEWHDPGSAVIILRHRPATVTSVTEYLGSQQFPINHEPLDGSSFTIYGWDYEDGTGNNGILHRFTNGYPTAWLGNRVKIVYSYGSATIPWDIRGACLALIDHLWSPQRGTDGTLPSGIDIDEVGRTFGAQFGPAFALPNRVKEMLEPYHKGPRVA